MEISSKFNPLTIIQTNKNLFCKVIDMPSALHIVVLTVFLYSLLILFLKFKYVSILAIIHHFIDS